MALIAWIYTTEGSVAHNSRFIWEKPTSEADEALLVKNIEFSFFQKNKYDMHISFSIHVKQGCLEYLTTTQPNIWLAKLQANIQVNIVRQLPK